MAPEWRYYVSVCSDFAAVRRKYPLTAKGVDTSPWSRDCAPRQKNGLKSVAIVALKPGDPVPDYCTLYPTRVAAIAANPSLAEQINACDDLGGSGVDLPPEKPPVIHTMHLSAR